MGTSLGTLDTILLIIQVITSLALIGLILIQHGKGADAGAAFGSGASSTVFGARGSSSFLSRATAYLATIFFVVSFLMFYNAVKKYRAPSADNTTQQQSGDKKKPADKGKTDKAKGGSTGDSPAPKSKSETSDTGSDTGKSSGDSPAPKSKNEPKSDASKSNAGAKPKSESGAGSTPVPVSK